MKTRHLTNILSNFQLNRVKNFSILDWKEHEFLLISWIQNQTSNIHRVYVASFANIPPFRCVVSWPNTEQQLKLTITNQMEMKKDTEYNSDDIIHLLTQIRIKHWTIETDEMMADKKKFNHNQTKFQHKRWSMMQTATNFKKRSSKKKVKLT